MTDLFASQMWDEVSRDMDAERAELSRTAALADAEKVLWPLVSGAVNETDLRHRLALAEDSIALIAARRGYDQDDLVADLTRQWKILAEAQAAAAPKPDPTVQQHEARLRARGEQMAAQAYLKAVSTLIARAAADNPALPIAQCQALAEEALTKQGNAFPLAYESWGHVADGPFTERAKNWSPPKLPGAGGGAAAGGEGAGGSGGGGEAAGAPAAAAAPAAGAHDDLLGGIDQAHGEMSGKWDRLLGEASTQHAAGPFTDRVKKWVQRGHNTPAAPAAGPTFDERNDDMERRLDEAEHKLKGAQPAPPSKPSEATPGHVPDLDLSQYLHGPDKAVENNSHGNSAVFDSPMHQVHSDEFADRRIDNGLNNVRDEQARSDATEPSTDDAASNMERRLDQGEQANQQARQDMGPQPAHFSHEPRPQHAPVPKGPTGAPAFMEPHAHSHTHPASYLQDSLFE